MSLIIFNWFGYQVYISIVGNHADEQMIRRIDKNNYTEQDLVSIKFPAPPVAYNVRSTEFERMDGTIEIDGIQYNYVKRRLINDSLELLCIPNETATKLNTARDEFFRLVNGLQHAGHSEKGGDHTDAFKSLNQKYCHNGALIDLQAPHRFLPPPADHYRFQIPSVYLSPHIHPPDAVA
jgi:hypothetical protein